jgi:hypothetical protein
MPSGSPDTSILTAPQKHSPLYVATLTSSIFGRFAHSNPKSSGSLLLGFKFGVRRAAISEWDPARPAP